MSVNKKRMNDFVTERGGFTMVPNELWELQELDHTAKVVWCYIYSRPADWMSSQNNVARNLNLHVDTVSKYIARLKTLNMLKISKGSNNALSFEITPPNEWMVSIQNGIQCPKNSSTLKFRVPQNLGYLNPVKPDSVSQNLGYTKEDNNNTKYSTVQSSGSTVTACEPSLLESSVSTACAVTSINTQANPTSSPPVARPPSPSSLININPEDLKLVEAAEAQSPNSGFVRNCRAALEKYGSLSEARRNALKGTQPQPHTPTSKNSTTGRIDANKPMLTKEIALTILENNSLSAEKKVQELNKYTLDENKKPALASFVSNYFVVRSVDEAEFIIQALGLSPTPEEQARLEKRKLRKSV